MTGKKILALRTKLGWTQRELADYLGIDRSSLTRIEQGARPLPRACLRTIEALRLEAATDLDRAKRADSESHP